MAKIEITLSLRRRRWVSPLLNVAAYSCALVSLVNERAADWLSERLTTFIAKHGFRIEAR